MNQLNLNSVLHAQKIWFESKYFNFLQQEINSSTAHLAPLNVAYVKMAMKNAHQREFTDKLQIILFQLLLVILSYFTWSVSYAYLDSTNAYFFPKWCESFMTIVLLYAAMKCVYSINLQPSLNDLFVVWPLHFTYGILVAAIGFDYMTITRKSGGTEFAQLNVVLILPIMFCLLHWLEIFKAPSYAVGYTGVIVLWKCMCLFQDRFFVMSITLSLICVCYSIIYCFYLLLMKSFLSNGSIIQIIYQQALLLLFFIPCIMIASGEQFQFPSIFQVVLVAVTNFVHKFTFLLFLKKMNLLLCICVGNIEFAISSFSKALVYKLDCHISTTIVCLFIFFDLLFMNTV